MPSGRGRTRAGALGALGVLLPLLSQAGTAGFVPSGCALWLSVVVACGGIMSAARRPLPHGQALAAVAGAQAALQVCYVLPGACAAAGGRGPAGLLAQIAPQGHGTGELLAGYLVALALTARLLGVADGLAGPLRAALVAAIAALAARPATVPGPLSRPRRAETPTEPGVWGACCVVSGRSVRAPPWAPVISPAPRPLPGAGTRWA
ncbi:hypothetical protein ACFVUW_20120 [Streptomyces xiamenensis]|uniref:hypothetical protein n=1 Tax=Streptomyces xiamenensis TaxID=408015 RepID=UPI0036E298B1